MNTIKIERSDSPAPLPTSPTPPSSTRQDRVHLDVSSFITIGSPAHRFISRPFQHYQPEFTRMIELAGLQTNDVVLLLGNGIEELACGLDRSRFTLVLGLATNSVEVTRARSRLREAQVTGVLLGVAEDYNDGPHLRRALIKLLDEEAQDLTGHVSRRAMEVRKELAAGNSTTFHKILLGPFALDNHPRPRAFLQMLYQQMLHPVDIVYPNPGLVVMQHDPLGDLSTLEIIHGPHPLRSAHRCRVEGFNGMKRAHEQVTRTLQSTGLAFADVKQPPQARYLQEAYPDTTLLTTATALFDRIPISDMQHLIQHQLHAFQTASPQMRAAPIYHDIRAKVANVVVVLGPPMLMNEPTHVLGRTASTLA